MTHVIEQTESNGVNFSITKEGDKTSVTIVGNISKDDVQSILNILFNK